MGASGKTVEELEKLCIELATRNRVIKDSLKQISKLLNQEIKKL